MDEIIAFLMKQLLPAISGAGTSWGLSQMFGRGGDDRQGQAPSPSMAAPAAAATPSLSAADQGALSGAGSTTRPSVGNFGGGTTGGPDPRATAQERPVSSGFTTLTPSPMSEIQRAMAGNRRQPATYV